MLGVQWRDIDWEKGRLRVDRGLHYINKRFEFLPPKTATSRRSVTLTPNVLTRLRQHRTEQAQRLLALGIRVDAEHVVCDRVDGRPIEPSAYSQAIRRFAKRLGMDGVHCHSLRHGVATALAARGVRPELVSRHLGHADVGFTLSTYVWPTDDALDVCADAIGEAL